MSPAAGGRNASRSPETPSVYVYLVLGVAGLLSVFPLYWMFVVASNDSAAINDMPPRLVPGSNFTYLAGEVFERTEFRRALINSIVVSASIAITQVFLATLAGFAFAKFRFPGRRVLLALIIVTMMVPTQLNTIPLLMTMVELQWTNTLRALIVPDAVTAFGVFWMRQLIAERVSDEMIEAAAIDGASSFRIYRTIVLPLIRPGASVLALFAFVRAWNDFLWPLVVVNRADSQTVQIALRQLQNQAYTTDFGVEMAGTVVATAPLLLLFLLVGRQIVDGVMSGGSR